VKDAETGDIVAQNDDYQTQAELLYDELVPMLQHEARDLSVVAIESFNDVSDGDPRIPPDNFRFVYNGRDVDESYERNSHLLGGA
jgi:hypothetical protein